MRIIKESQFPYFEIDYNVWTRVFPLEMVKPTYKYLNIIAVIFSFLWVISFRDESSRLTDSIIDLLNISISGIGRDIFNAILTGILATLMVLLNTIIHEFIHIMAFPGGVFSDKNILFYGSKYAFASVSHDGIMPKQRYLISIILPLLLLSIINIIGMLFGNERIWFICYWFLMLNIISSGSDIIVFFYALFKVPSDAIIYMGYWKKVA